jgi:hypothetical protein
MTTTKSYLAGLGMTGIVIASVLVLLAVGTGLVAFDGRRDIGGDGAPLERVVVGKGARSAGGERGSRDPDAPAAPAAAARPPLAATSGTVPHSVRGPGSTGGRHLVRRPGTGDGGVQARTRDSLGGGAPARDASEDGGGAAADGPPGRAKRGAGAPPGRVTRGAGARPGGSGGGARSRLPGRTEGWAPTATPDGVRERAGGHGRGPALGRAKRRVEQALDSGALPALLP